MSQSPFFSEIRLLFFAHCFCASEVIYFRNVDQYRKTFFHASTILTTIDLLVDHGTWNTDLRQKYFHYLLGYSVYALRIKHHLPVQTSDNKINLPGPKMTCPDFVIII